MGFVLFNDEFKIRPYVYVELYNKKKKTFTLYFTDKVSRVVITITAKLVRKQDLGESNDWLS